MKDKILITGGCGFIGSHLAQRFTGRYRVTLLDNLDRNAAKFVPDLLASPDVEMIEGSVTDPRVVERAAKGASVILHLAAIAGVSNYYSRPVEVLRTNIQGTFNLLDAAKAAGTAKFIHFSTSEVYGPHADKLTEEAAMTSGPVSESRWVYSISKQAGEHAVIRTGEASDMHCAVIRPFNVYGPRQIGEGAISNFSNALCAGKKLTVYGSGEDVRAWCHVSDLVEAVEQILVRPEARNRAFNIGNPDAACTTIELARALIDINGGGELEFKDSPHAPIPLRLPNIDRAKTVLGFTPRMGLRDGLADTLNWFKRVGTV